MVATYTELLQRDYADKLGPDAAEFMGFITEGSHRVERLLDDLLAYARAANVAGEVQPGLIETGSALDAATLNLHRAIEESGAEIIAGRPPQGRDARDAPDPDLPEPDRERDQVPRRRTSR